MLMLGCGHVRFQLYLTLGRFYPRRPSQPRVHFQPWLYHFSPFPPSTTPSSKSYHHGAGMQSSATLSKCELTIAQNGRLFPLCSLVAENVCAWNVHIHAPFLVFLTSYFSLWVKTGNVWCFIKPSFCCDVWVILNKTAHKTQFFSVFTTEEASHIYLNYLLNMSRYPHYNYMTI